MKDLTRSDFEPLISKLIIKMGLLTDSHPYFDHHHTVNDTFAVIIKSELELGASSIAAMMYLMNQN